MAKKKWVNKAFDKAKEGALGSLDQGSSSFVAKARKDRAKTVRRLLLIANGSKSAKARAKARAAINAIERALGPSGSKK